MKRIERMCDIVVRLESFEGSEKHKNPVFKDYQGDHLQSLSKTKFLWFLIGGFSLGLFHVIKVVHPNVSVCPRPEAADFGFKVRRKKFVVEVSPMSCHLLEFD